MRSAMPERVRQRLSIQHNAWSVFQRYDTPEDRDLALATLTRKAQVEIFAFEYRKRDD